jgi:hypothetical protein
MQCNLGVTNILESINSGNYDMDRI